MSTAVAVPDATSVRARRVGLGRLLLYGCAGLLALFMLTPVYLIALAALSPPQALIGYPRPLVPTGLSLDNVQFFTTYKGIVPAFQNSLQVGVLTVTISLVLGCPAGYALARYWFRGKGLTQLLLVNVRAIPPW